MTTRKRADKLLVECGLFESRAKAQAAIAAGVVKADGTFVEKASDLVSADARIEAQEAFPYVSRGALKLVAALDHFGFDPKGLVAADIGASTGGFTDVLIKRGARRVYAVDVGQDQLHSSLRGRPEVVSLEKTDVRELDGLPEPVDCATIDVSFISLKLVLLKVFSLMRSPAWLVALIKPQFEAGRGATKKGIVRNPAIHTAVCDDVAAHVAALGWTVAGVRPSPITGREGNHEFLIGATRKV